MAKMNRRDYLLQMGAGAVGLVAASPLDVLAEHKAALPHQRPALRWKPTSSLPDDPRVTVIFGGLMGFFYAADGSCEIGTHKGEEKHRLMMEIWERNNRDCKQLFPNALPNPGREIKIQIVGRSTNEANFFQIGDYSLERRKHLDPQDFRWLPDLDSNDFYPDNHDKVKEQFKHKIVVKHGTFYTHQKTSSTFERIHPPEAQRPTKVDFYEVANYMGARIAPNQNEDVLFQINPNSAVVFRNKPGFSYDIHIFNHCYKNDHEYCDFDPEHEMEKERNHFHFMRKMVQVPPGGNVYGLKLKVEGQSKPDYCPKESKKGTDEAPCMGAGFGQTVGMP